MTQDHTIPIPAPRDEICIETFDLSGQLTACCHTPRSVLVKSPFRNLTATAWIELYRENLSIPLDFGYRVDISIEGNLIFRGYVDEIRLDSVEAPLTFVARRNLQRLFPHYVSGLYRNMSPTEILADVLESTFSPRLDYVISSPSNLTIERLGFLEESLFDVISLLAVLDGNALWDVSWDPVLRYRSALTPSDRRIRFDPDRTTLRIWQTGEDIRNAFLLHGGLTSPAGSEFQRAFSDQDSVQQFGYRPEHLYNREIVTEHDFELYRDAVLSVFPKPDIRRFLDLAGLHNVRAGDVIQIDNPPFPLSGDLCRQPVEMVEINYRHARVTTRLHFNAGLSRTASVQSEPKLVAIAGAVSDRFGPFQLDRSALDGSAHLDMEAS